MIQFEISILAITEQEGRKATEDERKGPFAATCCFLKRGSNVEGSEKRARFKLCAVLNYKECGPKGFLSLAYAIKARYER